MARCCDWHSAVVALLAFLAVHAPATASEPQLSEQARKDNDYVVYTFDKFSKDSTQEIRFLEAQQAVFWPKEKRVLSMLGVKDGQRILDLGGGPGWLSRNFLEWLPKADVTLFEVNSVLVDHAKDMLKPYTEEGRFHPTVGNAGRVADAFPENHFDVIVARLLFQHLPNPQGVVREARRILKPGGKLIVLDSDEAIADIQQPDVPEVNRLWAMHEDFRQRTQTFSSDSLMGRKLLWLMKDEKFDNVESDMVATSSEEFPMEEFMPLIGTEQFHPLVRSGEAKMIELKRAERLLRAQYINWNGKGERPIVMCFLFVISGTKPAVATHTEL